MERIDVWVLHQSRRVLITDEPGVPVEVCGYVSEAAKQAAQARGMATVSEIGFNREDHAAFEDWKNALVHGNQVADRLGYAVDVHSLFEPWAIDDDGW